MPPKNNFRPRTLWSISLEVVAEHDLAVDLEASRLTDAMEDVLVENVISRFAATKDPKECVEQLLKRLLKRRPTSLNLTPVLRGPLSLAHPALIGQLFSSPGLMGARLKRLCIGLRASNVTLRNIAKKCPNLEELSLQQSNVSDHGLNLICAGCPKIRRLDILDCDHVSNEGIASVLEKLPRLTSLNHDGVVKAIELVGCPLRLTHVDQYGEYIEDVKAKIDALIRTCPNLKSLHLEIRDDNLGEVGRIPNLRQLHLETHDDVGAGFLKLIGICPLVSLELVFLTMPSSHLRTLATNCPNLKLLRLFGCEFSNSETLAATPQLRPFGKLTTLELNIHGDGANSISPAVLYFMLGCCYNLESLDIYTEADFIDEAFIKKLIGRNPLRKLNSLMLNLNPSTKLTSTVAKTFIDSLPALVRIDLANWNIEPEDMKILIDYINENNLTVIIL